MRIYASEGEASIEASAEAFADLKLKIEQFIASPAQQLAIAVAGEFDPKPYDALLDNLIFKKNGSALHINAEASVLCIAGSNGNLALFAKNLPYDAEDPKSWLPYHIHFDHAGWPNEVTSNSLALVLCKRRDGG